MGITGIFPIIRKSCPGAITKCTLSDLSGRAVLIDSNNFIYKFMYGGRKGAHLSQFASFYIDLRKNDIDPIFVFDGKAPEAKQAVKDAREKRKVEHTKKVNELEQSLKRRKLEEGLISSTGEPTPVKATPQKEEEIKKLEAKVENVKKQVIHVTPEQIQEVKTILKLMGAKVLQAHSEGEGTCAVLNRLGVGYAVLAEDADVIAFGGVKLVRGVGGSYNREAKMEMYDIPKILEDLKITPEQFIEISILSKSDFSSKIAGIGVGGAIKRIRDQEMWTIENVIMSMKPEDREKNIPKSFNPTVARKIFYDYLKRKEVYDYAKDIKSQSYDHENICKFLKGKLPFYRESSSEWCKMLTGQYPESKWYGQDEDEDGRTKRTPKKFVPPPPKVQFETYKEPKDVVDD